MKKEEEEEEEVVVVVVVEEEASDCWTSITEKFAKMDLTPALVKAEGVLHK